MADAVRLPSSSCAPARKRRSNRAVRADEFYVPKAIDNSRVVKVADPRERRELKRLVMLSLLLFVAILAGAYQRFALIRAGYRAEDLKNQCDQLLEANRQLRLEEASLRDPQRVGEIARNELGFGVPAPGQVMRLERPAPAEPEGAVVARVQPSAHARALKAAIAATVP